MYKVTLSLAHTTVRSSVQFKTPDEAGVVAEALNNVLQKDFGFPNRIVIQVEGTPEIIVKPTWRNTLDCRNNQRMTGMEAMELAEKLIYPFVAIRQNDHVMDVATKESTGIRVNELV